MQSAVNSVLESSPADLSYSSDKIHDLDFTLALLKAHLRNLEIFKIVFLHKEASK